MTRGTIAFIDYDKATDKYLLFVSQQFNGDMAPDMDRGEKLIGYFRNIYLNKQNYETKRHKIDRIVYKMLNEFGYENAVAFRRIPLNKVPDGTTYINLQTMYLNKKEKDIDYNNDIWSTWFDYSDFLYIVPICDTSETRIVMLDEKEDGSQDEHYLEKDNLYVFCFREYVGYVSSKDGRYIEENQESSDDSTDENEPFSAPPLSIVPPRRFVEILTQYKDGDRYCLVVRDSDNKHVLFKEMR